MAAYSANERSPLAGLGVRGGSTSAQSSPEAVTFLIVDDHPVVCFALKHLLSSQPGWRVMGNVSTLQEARETCMAQSPRVVLLDLMFPGECGLEFLGWLHGRMSSTIPIVYSIQPEAVYSHACIRAGAAGYVGKGASVEALVSTISLALRGETVVNGQVVNQRTTRFVRSASAGGIDSLSRRELEVLNLIGQGLSNKRIAQILCRSAKTVESHRYRIARKLKVINGPELVHFALQHQIASDLMPMPLSDRGLVTG